MQGLERITDFYYQMAIHPLIDNPEKLRLRGVKAVKIYYCLYGRNAWHSTWIQKYFPNCMQITFDAAKQYAESLRIQGSVFSILEMPALQIDSGSVKFLATQINTITPLRGYSPNALRDIPTWKNKIDNLRENYLKFGAPIEGSMLSFDYDSRFWRTRQPPKNSVILLYFDSNIELEALKTTKLKSWRSNSVGEHYYLNWHEVDNAVRQSAVMRIAKQSGF